MTEQDELIEKYIQNKLSAEEALMVNQLLENDINFKTEFTLQTNLKKAVKKDDDAHFRNLISDIESKAKIESPIKRHSYAKWLAAAGIVLLLGLSYFFTMNQKPSTNELFASYFEPYRNVVQPLERGSDQQDKKTLAFLAYEKGEYEKAIALFTDLYTTTKEPYYLFYKANALLKLEKANEAVPLLLEHLKTKDTLTEKTTWYLALAYLKLNDKPNARITLKKVITEGKYKTTEAQELLKAFK
ncbi:tetratricopeptide repeat protein [Yeosuana marina]|uniref:tetratricopeptide repeat protein n=1 Tax=Yeosuana marina TaxID=1565536 RepID=UPI0030EBB1D7|tara:strand:- start:1088 stop:1816 length:729 start_codon:yes stop_codon:yes gene_type:complete